MEGAKTIDRFLAILLIAAMVGGAGVAKASSDLADWPETAAMLAAPDDESAVFTFVSRAREAQRYAEAANALERFLRFDPENERAAALLAEVYDDLGFTARADAFRREADKKPASAIGISGYASVSVGYDSNPAAAPLDSNVGFFFADRGEVIELNIGASPDDSLLTTARAQVDIDVAETGDAPPLFASVSGYATHFSGADDQDDYGASVKFGAELPAEDARLRVYGFADADFFDHRIFSTAGFVGAEYRFAWNETLVTLDAYGGYRDFHANALAPDRDEMDGAEGRASVSLLRALDENIYGYALFGASFRDAAVDYERRIGLEAVGALIATLPRDGAVPEITLTLGGGAAGFRYLGADPTFDALNDRKDLSLFAFGSASVEIADDAAFDISLSYRRRLSEYDIYESEGLRASLKLVKRF